MTQFTPREVVSELDRYIVGQAAAKVCWQAATSFMTLASATTLPRSRLWPWRSAPWRRGDWPVSRLAVLAVV